jgi:inorganic triphosphatase YgiF
MEVELKLIVKPAVAGGPIALFTKLSMQLQLAGLPLGSIYKYEIKDLYYDTADGTLAAAGIGLRCRVENERVLVTMKISRYQEGALVSREEFEEPLTQERLDWVLSHAGAYIEGPFSAEALAAGQPSGSLQPILVVGTARLVRPIGSVAKLVMDMVEYPGFSAHPIFEIEVEAVGGKGVEKVLRQVETELYALAGGDLAPAALSKLERGLKLKGKAN